MIGLTKTLNSHITICGGIMKGNTKKLLRSAVVSLALSMAVYSSPAAAQNNAAVQTITPNMSCGVCRMSPARYPKWHTQLIFKDGEMVPFDGSKDMFKYLLMMDKFTTEHKPSEVAAAWVKDFNSGSWFDAKEAFFVVGSNAMGPMGKELVPFQKKQDAQLFQKEQQGKIMTFTEIDINTVKSMGMQMRGMGKMHGNMMQH